MNQQKWADRLPQAQKRERELSNRERQQLETLELITSQMPAAVTRCSRDFRYLWANQNYADLVGCPLGEIVGRPIIEVLGPERFESLWKYFVRVLAGERVSYEAEVDYYSGAGRRWISASYTPTFDADADANGWVAVIVDITERKKAEEERFRLATIVESSNDAIISKDLNGIISTWNRAAENLFGYAEQEAVGQPITMIIPSELPDGEVQILRRVRAGERFTNNETVRVAKGGKKIDVSLTSSPIKDTEGRIIGASKIVRDITEKKRAETALQESEERFRLVANTAPVMIWMSGTGKLCTYFNQPWLQFTGRALKAELGNGWTEGVYSEDLDRCLDTYIKAFDRRKSFQMEYRLRRHDGEYRWILDSGVPRFNADGSFAGYVGSCIDVTERKLAEQALSTVGQRLIEAHEEERTRIARELHDDINQRLALVAVNLDHLKTDLPESAAEGKQEIEEAAKAIEELGIDVQALSHRLHSSRLEYLGLAAAATSLCKELSSRQGVKIDFHCGNVPKDLPREVSLCLFRVLQEALQNAIKYSGLSGFQVRLTAGPNEIQLEVQDSGIGFDPNKVMKRNGLGLTSMRERLKLVGGQLTIDSRLRRGTTIQACVPLKTGMESATAA